MKPKSKPKKKRPKLTPEQRFKKNQVNFVVGALRRRSIFWPPRLQVLEAAYVGQRISKVSGRYCKHWRCAHCAGEFPASLREVDHIKPVGKKTGSFRWIPKLLCGPENLQVLCTECHLKKTNGERSD